MQTSQHHQSVWQRLKNREITCSEALKLLVDEQGIVHLELLDREVSQRFLRTFPALRVLPTVIPLLLGVLATTWEAQENYPKKLSKNSAIAP